MCLEDGAIKKFFGTDLTNNKGEKKKREIMHSPGGVPGVSGLETHNNKLPKMSCVEGYRTEKIVWES